MSNKGVRGLSEWLSALKLSQYQQAAQEWCLSQGAADIDEVKEEFGDKAAFERFKKTLKLKPLEDKRISKDIDAFHKIGGGDQVEKAAESNPPSRGNAAVKALPDSKIAFGDKNDPYHLLEEIGKGATATVFKCVKHDEIFACKAISLTKLKLQPNFKEIENKLYRETQILYALRHPNVVALHEAHETADKLYLVMECVEGGDLFERILKKPKRRFSETDARYIFIQLVDALQYIHSKGVVHRDLKPENILVDAKHSRGDFLHVKISDFGHSKLINDGLSIALTKVGTPQYWAPEVSDSGPSGRGYDYSVDLWSLGVVLYVMLEGCYPFDAQSDRLANQIKRADFRFRPDSSTSAAARDIISNLIVADPKKRLSLSDCKTHRWWGNVAAPSRPVKEEGSETISLPCEPANQRQLRQDLVEFSRKFSVSAVLKRGAVEVMWPDFSGDVGKRCDVARAELMKLLDFYFPGKGFATCSTLENPPKYAEFFKTHLKVLKEDGAGLELHCREGQDGGMEITQIFETPGQEGLRVGDLIVEINDIPLALASAASVEEVFAAHFGDGVKITVKRNTSAR